MICQCPTNSSKPNYLRTSKCYLTITKRYDNLKIEIVIDITPIQIIIPLYLINLLFAKIISFYYLCILSISFLEFFSINFSYFLLIATLIFVTK